MSQEAGVFRPWHTRMHGLCTGCVPDVTPDFGQNRPICFTQPPIRHATARIYAYLREISQIGRKKFAPIREVL